MSKRSRSTEGEEVEFMIVQLKVKIDQTKEQIERAKKEIEEAEEKVNTTDSAVKEIEAARCNTQAKLADPALSMEDMGNLCTELKHLRTKEKQLRTELKYLRTKEQQLRTELKQLRTKLKQLRTEKEQLRAKEQQLTGKLHKLSTANEHGTAVMAQLRELRGKVPAHGTVMSFSSGLLLDPRNRDVYIRSCYKPFFKELMISKSKERIITGTPGTGKSFFLYYLLAELLALPEPPPYILLEHSGTSGKMWCYDHATGEVHTGSWEAFDNQLDEPKAWYICDGMQPRRAVRAHCILITSPCRSIYKEMRKSGAKILYMMLWDRKELLDCRAKVYSDSVPEDLAVQLYDRYGGDARYVLGMPSQQDQKNTEARLEELVQELTAAIDICTPAQITSGIGALETGAEVSHRVLHIITKDNFKFSHLDFASRWVANTFVARSIKDDIATLARLVADSRTSGSIRGHLHEQLMHRVCTEG